ncbi:cyclic lactone autoinducer peptide [Cytobacillus sp. FJAT-53684]|uniref:Cyclic lactone autoinducer peptide n=1 Tax=Cytobacillus mangrovibacter TaxID=3299024 RepID=A0ABW6JZ33_9BACI
MSSVAVAIIVLVAKAGISSASTLIFYQPELPKTKK